MNAPTLQHFSNADRSIGAILIDAGRLKPEEAERILRTQRELNLRFGDAAIHLGLLSEADILQALSLQFDYPFLQRGASNVDEAIVAAYDPFAPQVEALRALRSQLMLRWFDGMQSHRALAIVSPGAEEGRSWFAANLAVVFSQLGERTLLIDANLRKPVQHKLFGLDNQSGLSAILVGRAGAEVIQRVPALLDLSVLTAGAVPPNPQELLARSQLTLLLAQLGERFEVILIDTPAGEDYADSQTLAARAGGALMVTRRNRSRLAAVRSLAERLQHGNTKLVGSVLNAY